MRETIFRTDWGWVGLAATERGVRAVVLPKATKRAVERELRRVANGNSTPTFVLPPQGGGKYLMDGQPSFRVKVWKVLQRIPYGRVRSYGWVARKVGKPQAARAIGGACGANPVPLLVPCHRVVAGDGSLGGFSGGVGVKKRLLRLEGLTPR